MQYSFCTRCGSRLTHGSEGAKTISVKGGCLGGLNDLSGAVHIWCENAIVEIPAGVKRHEHDPPRGELQWGGERCLYYFIFRSISPTLFSSSRFDLLSWFSTGIDPKLSRYLQFQ